MNALATLINISNISLDIEITNSKELFQYLGTLFEQKTKVPAKEVIESLESRERLGSTGLGHQIAIPHGRIQNLANAHIGFIRLKRGIDFKAPDQQAVQVFVVMLVPEQASQAHLDILSQIVQTLSDQTSRAQLFTETNPETIYSILTEQKS